MEFLHSISPAINDIVHLICLLIAKHHGLLQYF